MNTPPANIQALRLAAEFLTAIHDRDNIPADEPDRRDATEQVVDDVWHALEDLVGTDRAIELTAPVPDSTPITPTAWPACADPTITCMWAALELGRCVGQVRIHLTQGGGPDFVIAIRLDGQPPSIFDCGQGAHVNDRPDLLAEAWRIAERLWPWSPDVRRHGAHLRRRARERDAFVAMLTMEGDE